MSLISDPLNPGKKTKNALTFKLGRKGINRIFAELFTESNIESD
jgi:hypothetical protein